MNQARKQRLIFILGLVMGASIALGLSLFALRQNINLFYTPTQIVEGQAPRSHEFRIGGIVKQASVHYSQNNAEVEFVLTDRNQEVTVSYTGILPTLFREGQGIVAEGKLNNHNLFIADQVLAKHDENYMPPEVAKSLYASGTR